jgi:hypothetical protein
MTRLSYQVHAMTYGPFHRRGQPGGPGCSVGVLPVTGVSPDGTTVGASLVDAPHEASEIELLRTVASALGVAWGKDDLGWWAAVPNIPISQFAKLQGETDGQNRPS